MLPLTEFEKIMLMNKIANENYDESKALIDDFYTGVDEDDTGYCDDMRELRLNYQADLAVDKVELYEKIFQK